MIKTFKSFKESRKSDNTVTDDDHVVIRDICEEHRIKNYTINSDGSIDVDGDVILQYRKLTQLPLKFNKISGNFNCCHNNLTSLEGSPKEVGGDFLCYDNHLTSSLKNAPLRVGNGFYCDFNQLTSLEGCPKEVGGNFSCSYNRIMSFEHLPFSIGDRFDCSGNNNPIFEIWLLFQDYSKIELFNYYDIIREVDGRPAIVLDRLNDFLEEIEKPTVEKVKGYINI